MKRYAAVTLLHYFASYYYYFSQKPKMKLKEGISEEVDTSFPFIRCCYRLLFEKVFCLSIKVCRIQSIFVVVWKIKQRQTVTNLISIQFTSISSCINNWDFFFAFEKIKDKSKVATSFLFYFLLLFLYRIIQNTFTIYIR